LIAGEAFTHRTEIECSCYCDCNFSSRRSSAAQVPSDGQNELSLLSSSSSAGALEGEVAVAAAAAVILHPEKSGRQRGCCQLLLGVAVVAGCYDRGACMGGGGIHNGGVGRWRGGWVGVELAVCEVLRERGGARGEASSSARGATRAPASSTPAPARRAGPPSPRPRGRPQARTLQDRHGTAARPGRQHQRRLAGGAAPSGTSAAV